jgi:two-component system, NtrC family, sensor histidine kinase HydH
MANQENYTLLSTAVQIANAANLSHTARLKSLARIIKKFFHLYSVTIYLLDAERRTLSRMISADGSATSLSCRIPLGEQAAGLCAFRKEPIFSHNGSTPDTTPDAERKQGTIFLPIMCGKGTAGVLGLELPEKSPLATSLPAVLQDILQAIAGLICHREITSRSDQRIRNLMTLNELGKALQHSMPFQELLSFILEITHRYSGSDCTILRIFKRKQFSPTIVKACRKNRHSILCSLLDIEANSAARMLATETPHLTVDLIADEDLPPSFVSVPLLYEEKTFGCLTFFGKTDQSGQRNFDEEDRELFEGMANLIATALVQSEHSRRMDMLVSKNDKKLQELSLLYRVSNAMHATTRINRLIQLNLTALVSGESHLFERAMLFLINHRSGVMQGMLGITSEECQGITQSPDNHENLLYTRWEISEEDMKRQQNSALNCLIKGTRLPLDKTLNMFSRAVLEKKLIVASGTAKENPAKDEVIKKFNLTSFATVPIIAKGEAVALLVLDNPVSGKIITNDDLHFLQLFANQASMAIENSMLYNRIEDANREFTEIRQRLLQGERLAALGETAASIAHELKTPLISIGGLARRLLRKEETGSTEWKYAGTIAREADRLEKMLNEILFFTRKATICYTQCSLPSIIDESLAVVSGILQENRIQVKKRISRTATEFTGDFQQIKQVCTNLFLNAGEAMKQGGILSISTAPVVLEGRDAISLKVRDTGGGIAPEILPDIFNPFFTTKDGGTGLGLPITHRIITNHGGKLFAENRSGSGAEFRVILPLHP